MPDPGVPQVCARRKTPARGVPVSCHFWGMGSPRQFPHPSVPAPLPAPPASAATAAPTPAAPSVTGPDSAPSAAPQRSAMVQTRARNARKFGNSPTSRGELGASAPRLVHETGSQQLIPSSNRTFTLRPRTPTLRKPMTDSVVASSEWRGRRIVTASGGSGRPAPLAMASCDESASIRDAARSPRRPSSETQATRSLRGLFAGAKRQPTCSPTARDP